MSMISSLIDKLNKSADEWNGSNMFELARMCREAADTIWELRDDLQRANAENAKLRELVRDMWQFTGAACKKYPRLFDQPAQGAQAVLPNAIDAFEQRMRELGIEVDE